MAVGDDALAAGMTLVDGATTLASDNDLEHNRTRDFLAQFFAKLKAVATGIANGGTGANTAAGARTNLGISAANTPSTAGDVQTDLNNRYVKADIDYAFTQRDTAIGARIARSGDTMNGELYLPNSSAASSGYTLAYINGDGRVSRGASAAKYKKHISARDPLELGDLFAAVFSRWQMRADSSLPNGGSMPADPTWRYGYIADSLVGTPLERFIVYGEDGEVESIDFISLLLAQAAQLDRREHALNARLAAIESALGLRETFVLHEVPGMSGVLPVSATVTPPPADPPALPAPASEDDPDDDPEVTE